jgi:hypothetical protein
MLKFTILFLCIITVLISAQVTKNLHYRTDAYFKVPVGVSSIDFQLSTEVESATFTIATSVNQEFEFLFNEGTCGVGKGNLVMNDVTFLTIELANIKGAGTGSCASATTFGAGLTSVSSGLASIGTNVTLEYSNTCPEFYTDVHSDFEPILLGTSSLYIIGSEPLLVIDFTLPAYYYDVAGSYGTDCSVPPTITNSLTSCTQTYSTSINYVDNCNFTVDDNYNNGSSIGYSLSGSLKVTAKLDLNVAGYAITRTVGAPVNWRVYLEKTISVSSVVNITNLDHCNNDADCNNNGCCEDNGSYNFCNCTCAALSNGYTGDYCQYDSEPPTCTIVNPVINISSEHGGCKYVTLTDIDEPVFTDNNQVYNVTRTMTYNGLPPAAEIYEGNPGNTLSDVISTICFEIGTHTINYEAYDVVLPDPSATANEKVSCGFTINVVDAESPHVDCQQCQTSDQNITLCRGTIGLDMDKLTNISPSSLGSYFGDSATYDAVFPGSEVAGVGYYDCDCVFENGGTYPLRTIVTNTWGSWGTIYSIDVHDRFPQVSYPPTQTEDFNGALHYSAADDENNNGTCIISVVFDRSPPTCVGFNNLTVPVDPLNKNYSVPVFFNESGYGYNASISGWASGPTLQNLTGDPTRQLKTNDTYWVGFAYNATYLSSYHIYDQAGNKGECEWKIIVKNPDPCFYPECDDQPPYVVNDSCPAPYTRKDCGTATDCVCGEFTPPTFADDRFVHYIEIYYGGSLYDVYNNDPTNVSDAEDIQLAFGNNSFVYVAYDFLGQKAYCNFTIDIYDQDAPQDDPLNNGCPSNDIKYTQTTNSSYTYTFNYDDACQINTQVTYTGGLVGTYGNNASTGTDVLDVGSYSYYYTIEDDSGNQNICSWTVEVKDNQAPLISCNTVNNPLGTITTRIDQEQTNTVVTFDATATDNWSAPQNIDISYSPYQPGGTFVSGNYTVTVTAKDEYNNTATCQINIEVLPPYPVVYFKPTLTKVIVSDVSSTSTPEFGATLEITTLTNIYHKIATISNDGDVTNDGIRINSNFTGNDNHQYSAGTIAEKTGNCPSSAAICYQVFEMEVVFDSCVAIDKQYDMLANIVCIPGDCTERTDRSSYMVDVPFTIDLSASNYCWQDLATIDVTASLTIHPESSYDQYVTDYNLGNNPTLPTHVASYQTYDVIGGIVTVSSPVVNTKNVKIERIIQEVHNDVGRTSLNSSYTDILVGSDIAYESEAAWAGFKYTEQKLSINDVWYVRYVATIVVEYDIKAGSRRRMLQVSNTNNGESNTAEKEVYVDTMVKARTEEIEGNTDYAIVLLNLHNCHDGEVEAAKINSQIAKFLNIDVNRVSSSIQYNENGYCVAEVAIEQSNCHGAIDILSLLEIFEEGVNDVNSKLHEYIYNVKNLHVNIDPNVFFVSQTPEYVYEAVTVKVADSNLEVESNLKWAMYILAGFGCGMLSVLIFSCLFIAGGAKNNENDENQGKRRYSIANLLSAAQINLRFGKSKNVNNKFTNNAGVNIHHTNKVYTNNASLSKIKFHHPKQTTCFF